jgi:Na+-translocating ferredoxin:NAD+ oxidoreductase RnfD subunit
MTIKSIKVQLGIFILALSAYAAFLEKDAKFLMGLCISVAVSILADSAFNYFKKKEFVLTESSIVTGLIIGCVLYSSENWLFTALGALLAIASKHVIRFRGRHLFNPAAFGILISVFLLGASTEWKGAYLWYFIVPFGIYVSFKIRKLELVASYLIASLILFGSQAIIQKAGVSGVLGYLNYFFIFIMLVEPMTTPATRYGKIIFGAGTGALIFILYAFGVKEAELLGLACFNLTTFLLNKRRQQ